MEIEEKIRELINNRNHVAYQLLLDMRMNWKEIPDQYDTAIRKFTDVFNTTVDRFTDELGAPSYIERD